MKCPVWLEQISLVEFKTVPITRDFLETNLPICARVFLVDFTIYLIFNLYFELL